MGPPDKASTKHVMANDDPSLALGQTAGPSGFVFEVGGVEVSAGAGARWYALALGRVEAVSA